jgi:hypothetical protein
VRRAAILLVPLALAPFALGCARLVANTDDYAAFRATRVGHDLERRLEAAERYLARRPHGAFADDVRAYVARAEPVFYASRSGSIAGLEAYLRVLPGGAHAGEASRRLHELQAERAEADSLGAAASAAAAAHEEAAASRERARDAFVTWLGLAASPALFGAPVAEAPKAFVVSWSLSLPQPTCAPAEGPEPGRRCAKLLELTYAVPSPSGPEARELTLEIAIDEDPDGKPRRISLGGPELWSRLEETRSRRALAPEDAAARIDAVADAIELVRQTLGGHGAGCEAPVVAPVVLDSRCGAVHALVRTGSPEDPDDRVILEPLPR